MRMFFLSNEICLTHFLLCVDQPNVARLLIANGADVNVRNGLNKTPLHTAAIDGEL